VKLLSKIELFIVNILLIILVILTFVNVLLRYFFNYSISGSVELSILLFSWIIFIGSSIAVRKSEHIKIDILDNILPEKGQNYLNLFISMTVLIVCLFLCINGAILTIKVFGETLGATKLPKAAVYMSFPIGFGLSSIHLIDQKISKFRLKTGEQ